MSFASVSCCLLHALVKSLCYTHGQATSLVHKDVDTDAVCFTQSPYTRLDRKPNYLYRPTGAWCSVTEFIIQTPNIILRRRIQVLRQNLFVFEPFPPSHRGLHERQRTLRKRTADPASTQETTEERLSLTKVF